MFVCSLHIKVVFIYFTLNSICKIVFFHGIYLFYVLHTLALHYLLMGSAFAKLVSALCALPGLIHQQVKAGKVTLTRWMRKMIQVNV